MRPFSKLRFSAVSHTNTERKKVDVLSKDAISQVLATEAQANAIRETAAKEAAALVEACERECAARMAEDVEKSRAALALRLQTVRGKADELILRSREEADADIEVLTAAAREKMREAVKHIEWQLCDV